MPRPPIQHHRLLLTLPDEWEDVMDRYKEIVVIKAVGRASAGFLGNPALGVFFIGAFLAGLGGIVGLEGVRVISDFFNTLQNLHNAKEGQDQRDAAFDFTNAQRAFINFFFPGLGDLPPPAPPPFTPTPGPGERGREERLPGT